MGLEIEVILGDFADGAGIGGTLGIVDNKAKIEGLADLGLGGKAGIAFDLAD